MSRREEFWLVCLLWLLVLMVVVMTVTRPNCQ